MTSSVGYIMKKEKVSKTYFAKSSTVWCRHLKTEAYSVFVEETKSFWDPVTKTPLDLFGKTRRSGNNTKTSIVLAKHNASFLQKTLIPSYIGGTEVLKMFFKHETERILLRCHVMDALGPQRNPLFSQFLRNMSHPYINHQ